MTTPEALKNLYVALGGEEADVENLTITPDVINAIAQLNLSISGGGELPEVTAADNGKVLTVVNGAWAAVAPETTTPTT